MSNATFINVIRKVIISKVFISIINMSTTWLVRSRPNLASIRK